MRASASTARKDLATMALPKADHLILSSVHRWEYVWLKETTDVPRIYQQWRKLSLLSKSSIMTEASATSLLPWEAVVEMIVSVESMILSSTFNASARHMLYTCVRITYWYFIIEHVDDVEVCASSFPSLPLLLQSLFLVFRWWFMTIVCYFSILIHHFYNDDYFEYNSKMCNMLKVECPFIREPFYY